MRSHIKPDIKPDVSPIRVSTSGLPAYRLCRRRPIAPSTTSSSSAIAVPTQTFQTFNIVMDGSQGPADGMPFQECTGSNGVGWNICYDAPDQATTFTFDDTTGYVYSASGGVLSMDGQQGLV